jgi:hypothetical protein
LVSVRRGECIFKSRHVAQRGGFLLDLSPKQGLTVSERVEANASSVYAVGHPRLRPLRSLGMMQIHARDC